MAVGSQFDDQEPYARRQPMGQIGASQLATGPVHLYRDQRARGLDRRIYLRDIDQYFNGKELMRQLDLHGSLEEGLHQTRYNPARRSYQR